MTTEAYGKLIKDARVLVVEDESLITMLIEDSLAEFACKIVGIASDLDEATEMAATLEIDVAILDMNLNGHQTYPIATTLRSRGIPFVFATGYGTAGLSDEFQATPILSKPFQPCDLARVLAQVLD